MPKIEVKSFFINYYQLMDINALFIKFFLFSNKDDFNFNLYYFRACKLISQILKISKALVI
jgi:hypothetical protein